MQAYNMYFPCINFVCFNQDDSCLAVGTNRGFLIFSTNPLSRKLRVDSGPVSIIEMLYESSLVAVVGSSEGIGTSCRMLTLWNTRESNLLVRLIFASAIQAVKMNLRRLVLVLQDELRIYDLKSVTLIHRIEREEPGGGICALSCGLNKGYLAIPYSDKYGMVTLIDTYSIKGSSNVLAHNSPLHRVAFNAAGTLLATVSKKGTVLRVWSVPQLEKLQCFRRGSVSCLVHSLSFSFSSDYLITTGSSGTVHIFKYDSTAAERLQHQPASWSSMTDVFAKYIRGDSESASNLENPSNGDTEDISDHLKMYYVPSSPFQSVGSSSTLSSYAFYSGLSNAYKMTVSSFLSYLPTPYREAIEATRCFSWVYLRPPCNIADSCASIHRSSDTGKFEIIVASLSGCAYVYDFDEVQGGECRLRDEVVIQYTMEDATEEIQNFSSGQIFA